MSGLYSSIKTDIMALWNAGWSPSKPPMFWRSNDLEPNVEPSETPMFLRGAIEFGRESVLAYGAGQFKNLRAQFGSVSLYMLAARGLVSEDAALDMLAEAVSVFRSQRHQGSYQPVADLSFIGDGSGFDAGPEEDGNWFIRGCLVVFQYRFQG